MFLNIRKIHFSPGVLILATVVCNAAPPPPQTFEFTVTATILETQCTWEHSGATYAELGELVVGSPVSVEDKEIGIMVAKCDSQRTSPFTVDVSLTKPELNGLKHTIVDKSGKEISGEIELLENEQLPILVRTTGTPITPGTYSNTVTMKIEYQ